jgi:hypothetical protein
MAAMHARTGAAMAPESRQVYAFFFFCILRT